MVNALCILFSLGAVAFVVIRAAALDKLTVWFAPVAPPESKPRPAASPRI